MNFPFAPRQASNFAYQHDVIFYTLVGLTVLFTVLVSALIIYFAVRYRAGSKVDRTRPHHENMPLEIAWTVIPTVLGLVMFVFGAKLFIQMRTPPKDAQEIYVVGKQWMWHIQHSNGVRENNTLHVPVGKPIKLTMISQDVLHAFYIPDFRVQFHVVPGRYTHLWFTATKAGKYSLFCGMYCGTQHSEMGGYVVAMEPAEYAKWLTNGGETGADLNMEQRGEKLFQVLSCSQGSCHKGQDNAGAPTLNGIFGKQRPLEFGVDVANEAYLREAILRPAQRLTRGYPATMPTYEGTISEGDVLDLVAYIRTLGEMPQSAERQDTGPAKGSVSRAKGVPLAAGALASEGHMNLGETDLPNTGPAVNAVAAENRSLGR